VLNIARISVLSILDAPSCYSIFSFICMFGRSLYGPFVLFLLAIVLSVHLRFTDSDYNFGIFKLFLLLINVREKMKGHLEWTSHK
jgi:hypothetical protein